MHDGCTPLNRSNTSTLRLKCSTQRLLTQQVAAIQQNFQVLVGDHFPLRCLHFPEWDKRQVRTCVLLSTHVDEFLQYHSRGGLLTSQCLWF